MNNAKGRPIAIPDDKKVAFKLLSNTPTYSWPAIALALVAIGGVITIDTLALMGYMNIWLAALLVTFNYYWFFSVIHDSVHRTICKSKTLNDFVGQLAFVVFAPYAALPLLRWAHMEHHRFTNSDKDPDNYCHGSWWSLPFRWMTIDYHYFIRLIKANTPQSRKVLKESLPVIIFGATTIITLIALGYGFEYLVLWYLPSRIAFIGIGYAFFWLPHSHWPNDDHDVSQASNFTLATTVRLGKEWLLSPLLQYQNHHLIHHLWPTTPFYNNGRVWHLLEDELRERDLAVAHDFTVQPEIQLADDRSSNNGRVKSMDRAELTPNT